MDATRSAPWPFLGTDEQTGLLNQTSELTAELGSHLARFVEQEIAGGAVDIRCNDCAFRRGTFPNESYSVADALKCLLENRPFHCHLGGEKVCGGYRILNG